MGGIVVGLLAAAVPLTGWAAARTPYPTIRPALGWLAAAWCAWALVAWGDLVGRDGTASAMRYLALCLSAAAGIAVLGARRPGAAAWNAVVVALLAVLLLPVAEGFGRPRLNPLHQLLLGGALTVAVVNYLPTCLGPAALAAGAGGAVQFWRLATGDGLSAPSAAGLVALAAAPWIGTVCWRLFDRGRNAFDREWRTFRDAFGLLWALRAREQFNRAAASAGWPVALRWSGLERPATDGPGDEAVTATLRAVLRRFGPAGAARQ